VPRVTEQPRVLSVLALVAASSRDGARVTGSWREVGLRGINERQESESSLERDFHLRPHVDDEWGRSESLDPDNVGDIADEGAGHRG
jgi:hypothetical protein